ncbi:hypothetical protein BKH44_08210 [Helicobacter sp. 13S00477-4]|nr:hypothetical protein BKH44_08210 [Helicobacter sp. 13S00477-4]
MLNQNNAENTSTSVNKQSQNIKTKKPDSKNGFFIGVEGDLGGSDMTYIYEEEMISSDMTSPLHAAGTTNKQSTTFDAGLVGGYQHYFGESQRHGIKVSAHIYSGFGNSWVIHKDKYGFNTLSYVPIKAGLDVKYLWDFFSSGKNILGLNAGVGYQFNAYIDGKDTYTASPDYKTSYDGESKKHKSIYENEFYPVIGLHYYYGHHQFELMYRFGGIWSNSGREHEKSTDDDTTYKDTLDLDFTIYTASYLSFNYTYRF